MGPTQAPPGTHGDNPTAPQLSAVVKYTLLLPVPLLSLPSLPEAAEEEHTRRETPDKWRTVECGGARTSSPGYL